MKHLLLCWLLVLLPFPLAHGITCYRCSGAFKNTCQREAVKCNENVNRCVTESLYSPGGKFLGVYATCAKAIDYFRCDTILMFATEIQVRNCCYTDRCNGKRAPFPPPDCAKPALGA